MTSRRLRSCVTAIVSTSVWIQSATVFAQANRDADKAYAEGRQAMKRKDYASACEKFAKSEKLEPSLYTALGLAECEERLGRFRASWSHVQDVLRGLPPGDDALPFAREIVATLEKRAPRLTVHVSPDSPRETVVLLNGIELSVGDVGKPIVVDVGPARLTTRTRAGGEYSRTVTLAEGEKKEVTLVALIEPSERVEPPAARVSTPAPKVRDTAGTTGKTVGYVSIAVGAAAIAGAGWFTYWAVSERNDARRQYDPAVGACLDTNSDCIAHQDTWKRNQLAAVVLGGVGVVAGGVGAYLLLSVDDPPAPSSSVRVVPWVGSAAGGAVLHRTW
jgi:hypothetical protein